MAKYIPSDKELAEIVNKNSYLDYDGCDDFEAVFSTRRFGNMATEQHSTVDFKEAIKAKKAIIDKYPYIKVSIDPVDEWVILTVQLST